MSYYDQEENCQNFQFQYIGKYIICYRLFRCHKSQFGM